MPDELYNPLATDSIAESLVRTIEDTPYRPLPPATPFNGAGVYMIYYHGPFREYRLIARANQGGAVKPIYVGKAVPKGGRVGITGNDPSGQELYGRLVEHAESIKAASGTLNIEDFTCRYLPVEHLFIALAEHTLINIYKPVWNYFGGFGNHDPGRGRYNQKRSAWDTVHSGRSWAARLQDNSRNAAYWLKEFESHIVKADKGSVQPIALDEDKPTEVSSDE